VLLAKLAGAMKASLSGAVSLFAAPLSQTARLIEALRAKAEQDPSVLRGGAGTAPEAPAVEAPVVEAPEVEAPEAEAPVVEAPEAETSETSETSETTEIPETTDSTEETNERTADDGEAQL
jgi:large subunit ribosomal protein L10